MKRFLLLLLLLLLAAGCGGSAFTAGQLVEHDALLDAAPEEEASAPDTGPDRGGSLEASVGGDGDARAEAGEAQAATCDGGSNPVTHSDGLGDTWQDCAPLGTYDQQEATSACEARNGISGGCQWIGGCAGVVGYGVCGLLAPKRYCWWFTGTQTGRVTAMNGNGSTCAAPDGGDFAWE
ncbi:MAG: hypothetical protein ACYDEA_01150 [Candidatus Dormibacteria bacterium]